MATATASAADYATPPFSGSPSMSMSSARSPDTASPIYPDRAIRPLPKSRLKSKLSPEQSASIVYPPDPPPISPTLHFSTITNVDVSQQTRLVNGDGSYPAHHADGVIHGHCTCGQDGDSGDEDVEFDHPDYRYATATPAHVNGGKPLDVVQRKMLGNPASIGSSADGYESFENTSNKKKRKIPVSSASGMHTSLSAEMANMGISSTEHAADDLSGGQNGTQHHQHVQTATSPSGTGISGAGRGRYGRQSAKHERRPLASTINTMNGYGSRMPKHSLDGKPTDAGIENTGGIISRAIKTAAEQGPLTPQKGEDNVSLLQSASSTTPKTQFTFACESESATKMADQQAAAAAAAAAASYGAHPGYPPTGAYPPGRQPAPNQRQMHTQGTQTTPQLRQGQVPGPHSRAPPPGPDAGGQYPPVEPKPRPRRRPSKEYALAARQRRLQQEYTNYHHRPRKGDMYICEFCEYEDIFGVPPLAMIRSYETKDREERKKAAERRRLLEKAKAKNRKGKKGKGGKGGMNNTGTNPPPTNGGGHAVYDPDLPPGPDGEEYYDDDEYGDEYEPVDGELYDDDQAYYPPPSARSGIQPPAPTPTAGTGVPVGRPPSSAQTA